MRLVCTLALVLTLSGCFLLPAPAPEPQQPTSNEVAEDPVAAPSPGDQKSPESMATDMSSGASEPRPTPAPDHISPLCQAVGNKLGSVSVEDCLGAGLRHGALTAGNHSLALRDFEPVADRRPLGRVLVIGGIHGDEFSSVSLMFRWLEILDRNHSGMFHWRFIPLANPDGLLREKSQRQNAAGVDLNRNFPTRDWQADAKRYWSEVTYRNPRRNPGAAAASEAETRWLVSQIAEFSPDVIVSIHAPHDLVDYDGPPTAPQRLGRLSLTKLGVFPGSLGNYAGHDLGLPVVTVELQSAGIMPSSEDISRMWGDLVSWLDSQLGDTRVVRSD